MNKHFLILFGSTIFASALVIISTSFEPAKAYTLTNDPDCNVAVNVFNPGYDACVGAYKLGSGENDVTDGAANNIVNKILNEDDIFGALDWTFGAKFSDYGYQGNSDLFSLTGLNNNSGTITLNRAAIKSILGTTDDQYEIAISFKAAKKFSIYQWNAFTGTDTINWSTAGTATNRRGKAKNLSHASLYVRKSDDTLATEVPEPGIVGAMGLLAFGAITSLKRKKDVVD